MKRFTLIGLGLLAGSWWVVAPQKAIATTTTPFISEVYPAPNIDESEWVEVTNPTNQIATISGWLLYDQLSSPSLLITINLTELQPNEAVAFELPTAKLNNTGDAVVLQDSGGNEIDRLIYSSSVLGKSWQKNSQFGDTYLGSPTKNLAPTNGEPTPTPFSISIEPTPTNTLSSIPNLTPTPTNKMPQIEIIEVMACPPDGEREWVKLYNAGNQQVWLNNWVLQDAQANRIALKDAILPNSYHVVDWNKALLNNQGDVLTLYDENGNQVVSQVIPQCSTGQPYALVSTSRSPTPTGIQQFSMAPSPSVIELHTNQTTAFLPTIPLFTLESEEVSQIVTPATMQIVQTSQVKPVPMAGAIISLSSLLLAVGFHNVTKQ